VTASGHPVPMEKCPNRQLASGLPNRLYV